MQEVSRERVLVEWRAEWKPAEELHSFDYFSFSFSAAAAFREPNKGSMLHFANVRERAKERGPSGSVDDEDDGNDRTFLLHVVVVYVSLCFSLMLLLLLLYCCLFSTQGFSLEAKEAKKMLLFCLSRNLRPPCLSAFWFPSSSFLLVSCYSRRQQLTHTRC